MCVELGISRRQIKDPNTGKLKTITEYLDAELNDRALEGVLEVGYRMYRLLNGTFSSILHSHPSSTDPALITRQSTRQLMNAIEEFFADWIWRWDFDRLESMVFASVFDGVPFHPLTKGTYVHIQRVGEMLTSRLGGVVGHMMVLGKEDGGLVWHSSGLVMRDVRCLRKYVGKLVEKDTEREREEEKKRLVAAKLKKEGDKVSVGKTEFSRMDFERALLSSSYLFNLRMIITRPQTLSRQKRGLIIAFLATSLARLQLLLQHLF